VSLSEHGTYTYQYDELYRLTSADNPTIPGEAYTYGALGNRLSSVATTGVWSYNANNELTGFDAVSFTYDDAGNQASKTVGTTTTSYHYDIEDRLVRVEDGSGTTIAEYYYDPFGRRLWKEAGGSRTYFGYADEGLIAEYDASGNQTREYGYAPGSTWSTNPLFLKQGSTYYWYQNDHQGRPQKIVTSSGAVVWSATYDSFGNCQVDASSTITNNLQGPGQYYDAETGLYYNLNRYYDPQTGRYLTTDPIEDGLNLYAYCFNDPVNLMDPEGLCALRIMGGLAEMAIGFTFGTATSPTIAGGVIGALVMAHGADQVYAGLKGLLGYDDTSYTSGLLQSLGFTPTQANLLDSAASVVATAGIGAVSMARSATVASTRAASAAQEAAAARAAAREAAEGAAKGAGTLAKDIAATFRGGKYASHVLESDVVAYRFSGGVSGAQGRFLTTRQTISQIASPKDAIDALKLPSGATAEQLNQWIIPKGTRIFYGRVEGGW